VDRIIREELKQALLNCANINEAWRKKLAIASVITQAFIDNGGAPPIIVGGMVVSIYSFGQYATEDIDMVTMYDTFPYEILAELGYSRFGKNNFHKELKSYVEFPSGDLAGDEKRVVKYDIEETGLSVYVLCVEDIILNRLDAYVATNDRNSYEWVLKLLASLYPYIDWSYIHGTAHKRGSLKVLEKVQRLVKRYNRIYEDMENVDISTLRIDLY
jgi:hypothetical protein